MSVTATSLLLTDLLAALNAALPDSSPAVELGAARTESGNHVQVGLYRIAHDGRLLCGEPTTGLWRITTTCIGTTSNNAQRLVDLVSDAFASPVTLAAELSLVVFETSEAVAEDNDTRYSAVWSWTFAR